MRLAVCTCERLPALGHRDFSFQHVYPRKEEKEKFRGPSCLLGMTASVSCYGLLSPSCVPHCRTRGGHRMSPAAHGNT